jgi:hypothetical protein
MSQGCDFFLSCAVEFKETNDAMQHQWAHRKTDNTTNKGHTSSKGALTGNVLKNGAILELVVADDLVHVASPRNLLLQLRKVGVEERVGLAELLVNVHIDGDGGAGLKKVGLGDVNERRRKWVGPRGKR